MAVGVAFLACAAFDAVIIAFCSLASACVSCRNASTVVLHSALAWSCRFCVFKLSVPHLSETRNPLVPSRAKTAYTPSIYHNTPLSRVAVSLARLGVDPEVRVQFGFRYP